MFMGNCDKILNLFHFGDYDTTWLAFMKFFHTPAGKAGTRPYSEFYARAANGTLPSYSWVTPRQGVNRTSGDGANDAQTRD